MVKSEYRNTNLIIQSILETLLKGIQMYPLPKRGVIKSHLVKTVGLKPATAEKYLDKMEKAEYIQSRNEDWGERTIIIYDITQKGIERYEWFVKINAEIE